MNNFINGLQLNRDFFREVIKPILENSLPDLNYSAALLGYGSDVRGFDTQTSKVLPRTTGLETVPVI